MSNKQEFQWTDELVNEYVKDIIIGELGKKPNSIELFKQSKLSKQQPKDYEILTMWRNNDEQTIHDYITEEMIQKGSEPCEEQDCKIYSVKRLSDGEVFSIGDEVVFGKDCKIKRLFISDNGLMWCDLLFLNGNEYHNANIGNLDKKVKQPILTTEDGVDIFEGDTVHIVNWCDTLFIDKSISKSSYNHKFKYFSTKEKAKEYIIFNNHCLSVNDIIYSIFKSHKVGSLTNSVFTISSNDLIELSKQKINK